MSAPDNTADPSSSFTRPKRSQVGRACNSCRLNRTKCDDSQPCKNCRIRGSECVFRPKASKNLPSTNKEVEKLKLRILELENELKNQKPLISPPPGNFPQDSLDGNLENNLQIEQSRTWLLGEIWTRESHTGLMQYYGSSSYFYFMSQIRTYLKEFLHCEELDVSPLPQAASKIFASPSSVFRNEDFAHHLDLGEEHVAGEDLTRIQEEYFISMFWQLYYSIVPILDHGTFKELYDLLWADQQSEGMHRKPSALVDIVLALSIQYGSASMDYGQPQSQLHGEDSSIGGRWFYHRCQMLLSSERERPSLSTIQCYIYSVVYLWNASFFNLAHETLAVAIRAAQSLGIHRKYIENFSEAESQISKRIWWSLFYLDTKASIDLGRPFSIKVTDMTWRLPAEIHETSAISDSHLLLSHEDLSYLEFHSRSAELLLTAQMIYETFYKRCTELIPEGEGRILHDDPITHEAAGKILTDSMKSLQAWTLTVPEALKASRKGNANPFSISRSDLEVNLCVPIWLQRQRLLLELLFHNIAMSLYRPFIRSSPSPMSLTPLADNCRHKCLHHAIATTNIIYQGLSETTIFSGMYQAYQYQWESVISMLGFALFRPVCPFASLTSKAIETGISNLETFGSSNFATALSSADVARSLYKHIEKHSKRFQANVIQSSRTPKGSVETPHREISADFSLHLSDDPVSLIQVSESVSAAEQVSQSQQNTLLTAEQFSARIAAGMHSSESLWLSDHNLDIRAMDTNLEIWNDWMIDH